MITQEDIDDRKEEWGEESALYVGAVLGEFPDNLDDVVVPLSKAVAAARRELEADGPVILRCDVARYGQDKTVVMRRQGPVARIVWRTRGRDTTQISAFLQAYCRDHLVDSLVVDDTGVGGGVVDQLKHGKLGSTRLEAFVAGAAANNKDYFVNRTAEIWWAMQNKYVADELDTDDDAALIGQVSSRMYTRDENGKIRLQSKQDMNRSPDEADALAMTFAAQRGRVRIWV